MSPSEERWVASKVCMGVGWAMWFGWAMWHFWSLAGWRVALPGTGALLMTVGWLYARDARKLEEKGE